MARALQANLQAGARARTQIATSLLMPSALEMTRPRPGRSIVVMCCVRWMMETPASMAP